jgi:hypothetical protein
LGGFNQFQSDGNQESKQVCMHASRQAVKGRHQTPGSEITIKLSSNNSMVKMGTIENLVVMKYSPDSYSYTVSEKLKLEVLKSIPEKKP